MNNTQEALDWIRGSLLGSFEHESNPSDEALSIVKSASKSSSATAASRDKEFDTSLARSINRLSIEAREKTFEEIHGVATCIPETATFIKSKLRELHEKLDQLQPKPISYTAAVEQNTEYIRSERFGLMFLRAERFDTTAALSRLLLFLEKKQQFFGTNTLGRPLKITDLSAGDRRTLGAGSIQVVPFRDRSGRVVFIDFMFCGDRLFPDIKCHFKVQYFLVITTFENDEEAQRHGGVVLVWYMDYLRVDPEVDQRWTKEVFLSSSWLPMRINAVHICITNEPIKRFWAQFTIAVSASALRKNFRVHQGTTTEVLFLLMTFGIPVEHLPVTDDGKLQNANAKTWLSLFLARDLDKAPESQSERIAIPTRHDVLFGKGDTTRNHVGNQLFRQLIYQTNHDYSSLSSRGERIQYTWSVLEKIEASSGRFLRKGADGWWHPVPAKEARGKITKAYASLKKAQQLKSGHEDEAKGEGDQSNANVRKRQRDMLEADVQPSVLSVSPLDEKECCMNCQPRTGFSLRGNPEDK